MANKALYVLGGMGPEASSYMYNTLIELSVKRYGVKHNNEFPEIVLHSIPVPDFISSTKNKNEAFVMLKGRVKSIRKEDVSCVSIACNTVHILIDELRKVSSVPFISMIEAVVEKVATDKIGKVGIIATPSTLKFRLYEDVLRDKGIESVVPNQAQIKVMENVIRNVIAGKLLASDSRKLEKIALDLKKRGAQGIILGCTETPLVFPSKFSLPVYNSVEILSVALLERYYGNKKKSEYGIIK